MSTKQNYERGDLVYCDFLDELAIFDFYNYSGKSAWIFIREGYAHINLNHITLISKGDFK